MAGKAKAPIQKAPPQVPANTVTPPTQEQIIALMRQVQSESKAPPGVVSEGHQNFGGLPGVGGQQVSPTTAAMPVPVVGQVAQPRPDLSEPAVPQGYEAPPAPEVQQFEGQPAVTATPVAPPPPVVTPELEEIRTRLAAMEEEQRRERAIAHRQAEEARIASLPPEQQMEARLEHERMLRLEAELKTERLVLQTSHPYGVALLDTLAEDNEIEIDPETYRKTVVRLQQQHDAQMGQAMQSAQAQLQQQAVAAWGIRPAPEQQTGPPTADDPDVAALQDARLNYAKRSGDPEMMRRLVKAGERLERRGITPGSIPMPFSR